MSTRDRVRTLREQGFPVAVVAAAVGISRSRAYAVLREKPPAPRADPDALTKQRLRALAGEAGFTFTPHLVPMTRGILATVYLQPARPVSREEAEAALREAYGGEPFVRVLDGESLPQTKATLGSNFCDVAVRVPAGC